MLLNCLPAVDDGAVHAHPLEAAGDGVNVLREGRYSPGRQVVNRFCKMFFESSPCLLEKPFGTLKKNLQNLFHNLIPQT